MNQEEIKAKSAALAELYAAKANGKTLQMLEDRKWTDWIPGIWSGSTLSYGPNFASDLSKWRVKPGPLRVWVWMNQGGEVVDSTRHPERAEKWRTAGHVVVETVEVLP
jgi:hypothetical protein